jgi:hypothetical protein
MEYPKNLNINKLKAKGKKLYALLYLPTGEFITWSDDPDNIWIPRGYTPEALVERVNDPDIQGVMRQYNATWKLIKRNQIVLPSIPQHYEKVELNYR